jgi:IS5 family transposase
VHSGRRRNLARRLLRGRLPLIEARRQQLHFGDGLIAEEVSDLREEWMKHADQVLEDEQLVAAVYGALAKRSPKSRTRGRRGTPAEVVMRLLLLKHNRNWSIDVLEREGRSGLSRFHTRGGGEGPIAKPWAAGDCAWPETVEKDSCTSG